MRKSICFAYFADGKFIGWYSDTFGSITSNTPKIYPYTEDMLKTIRINFSAKVAKAKGLAADDFQSKAASIIASQNPLGGRLMTEHKSPLDGYADVELRIVECPEYDGPNPNFDEAKYKADIDEYYKKRDELLKNLHDLKGGLSNSERLTAQTEYFNTNPSPKCDNWIYCDYAKVKEWASNEPTQFLEIIKFDESQYATGN
jgi:hypothetical protein